MNDFIRLKRTYRLTSHWKSSYSQTQIFFIISWLPVLPFPLEMTFFREVGCTDESLINIPFSQLFIFTNVLGIGQSIYIFEWAFLFYIPFNFIQKLSRIRMSRNASSPISKRLRSKGTLEKHFIVRCTIFDSHIRRAAYRIPHTIANVWQHLSFRPPSNVDRQILDNPIFQRMKIDSRQKFENRVACVPQNKTNEKPQCVCHLWKMNGKQIKLER